jgi:hypothetical protein
MSGEGRKLRYGIIFAQENSEKVNVQTRVRTTRISGGLLMALAEFRY